MKKLILFPLILILAIIGIIMTFNEPIQNSAIKHLTNSALKQPLVSSDDSNPHKPTESLARKRQLVNENSLNQFNSTNEPNALTISSSEKDKTALNKGNKKLNEKENTIKKEHYNYNSVKSVSPKMVSHAFFTHGNVIGIISLPAVKLKLPIYQGLDNDNLVKGAGTMKPHEQMGKGNYALAGHHMENPHILFSPLQHAKAGDTIYLTNRSKKVYVYRITKKKIISKYQIGYIKDIGKKKVITLITCASGKPEESNRIMIRGVLSSSSS